MSTRFVLWATLVVTWAVAVLIEMLPGIPQQVKVDAPSIVCALVGIIVAILAGRRRYWLLLVAAILTIQGSILVFTTTEVFEFYVDN